MKTLFFLMATGLMFSGVARADPAQCADLGTVNIFSPNFACQAGNLRLSDFVEVHPEPKYIEDVLLTAGHVTLDFDSFLHDVPASNKIFFKIAGGIKGADVMLNGVNGRLTETACATEFRGGLCGSPLALLNVNSDIRSVRGKFPRGGLVSPLFVSADFTVTSGSDLKYQLGFSTAPEPGTLLLLLSGLGSVAVRYRKRSAARP